MGWNRCIIPDRWLESDGCFWPGEARVGVRRKPFHFGTDEAPEAHEKARTMLGPGFWGGEWFVVRRGECAWSRRVRRRRPSRGARGLHLAEAFAAVPADEADEAD